ncbi:FBD-associated F-box protein At5g56370-like [Lolium rigidum]|uniref:FBD-associated F-box protein At5g56370-like n=1 Tax=Lolium rigidum TaxID=89674 RepID=UPI001F5D882F|nr:FBD-associated F-box protein At5g56370-like [Lolium rigidum]
MSWPSCPTTVPVGEDTAGPPATRHGLAPETLSPDDSELLEILYASLPEPPVSTFPSLCCAAADESRTDRVSRLPDDLLRRVVHLLPAKDGARTAVLSSRWRGLWRSAPLVLVDTHLLPAGDAGARPARAGVSSRAVAKAVSAALEAHPGPFPFVSLTCSFIAGADRPLLARWFHLLATKGVAVLVFFNRPWPLPGLRLPPSLFSCASLRRLWIGAWVFPDTATLPRGAAFPNLRELVLGCSVIEDKDLEFVLAVSPLLEILAISGMQTLLHARLANPSLRCAQFCLSILGEIAVVDAPNLERLFFCHNNTKSVSMTVKIGHVPKLRFLGYLEPGVQTLQIGDTIIKAGTKVSTSTTVSSVQMLALQLQFGVRSEVKMLPSFLRCFPRVETLIVEETLEPTNKLGVKFWKDAGPIECVRSHLKTLYFRELHGTRNEFKFLTFIAENARKLEGMYIVVKNDLSRSAREATAAKLTDLRRANWASRDYKLLYRTSIFAGGGTLWSLELGTCLSFDDPFYCHLGSFRL